jgi:hypothetical protein
MMKIEGAKHLFYERLDQWTDDYKAASELRLKVTEAFANVANGGAINQNLGALAMLDSMKRSEKRLQEKMNELMNCIDK